MPATISARIFPHRCDEHEQDTTRKISEHASAGYMDLHRLAALGMYDPRARVETHLRQQDITSAAPTSSIQEPARMVVPTSTRGSDIETQLRLGLFNTVNPTPVERQLLATPPPYVDAARVAPRRTPPRVHAGAPDPSMHMQVKVEQSQRWNASVGVRLSFLIFRIEFSKRSLRPMNP